MNVVHCHVGGVVVLKDLMDADDVGVVQLGEIDRFLAKQGDKGTELLLSVLRTDADPLTSAAAKRGREAFLDDNLSAK